jgi:hypothetical protein
MKRVFVAGIMAVLGVLVSFGQQEPTPILVFELCDELCSDPMKAHLDRFIIKWNDNPSTHAYIIGSADKNIPGRYSHYGPAIEKYFRFRGFPMERMTFARAINEDKMVFRFWLVPPDVQPPRVGSLHPPEAFRTRTLWDKSWISSYSTRQVDFGGDTSGEPCDFGLDQKGFSEELNRDPHLTGYLIGFSDADFNKGKTMAATNLTRQDLRRQHRVLNRQLRVLYGGRADERQLQLWIVPKGQSISLREARLATKTR